MLRAQTSCLGLGQMPPLARNLVDDKAAAVIGKWISTLRTTAANLPKSWNSTDIGNVGVSGEASFLNGRFNLLAAGGDVERFTFECVR